MLWYIISKWLVWLVKIKRTRRKIVRGNLTNCKIKLSEGQVIFKLEYDYVTWKLVIRHLLTGVKMIKIKEEYVQNTRSFSSYFSLEKAKYPSTFSPIAYLTFKFGFDVLMIVGR